MEMILILIIMAKPSLKNAVPDSKENQEIIQGRRGALTRLLVGAVVSAAHGRLQARQLGDEELIEGIAKADVGVQLKELSDEAVEKIDEGNTNVGPARRIIERALNRIQKTFLRIRPSR